MLEHPRRFCHNATSRLDTLASLLFLRKKLLLWGHTALHPHALLHLREQITVRPPVGDRATACCSVAGGDGASRGAACACASTSWGTASAWASRREDGPPTCWAAAPRTGQVLPAGQACCCRRCCACRRGVHRVRLWRDRCVHHRVDHRGHAIDFADLEWPTRGKPRACLGQYPGGRYRFPERCWRCKSRSSPRARRLYHLAAFPRRRPWATGCRPLFYSFRNCTHDLHRERASARLSYECFAEPHKRQI